MSRNCARAQSHVSPKTGILSDSDNRPSPAACEIGASSRCSVCRSWGLKVVPGATKHARSVRLPPPPWACPLMVKAPYERPTRLSTQPRWLLAPTRALRATPGRVTRADGRVLRRALQHQSAMHQRPQCAPRAPEDFPVSASLVPSCVHEKTPDPRSRGCFDQATSYRLARAKNRPAKPIGFFRAPQRDVAFRRHSLRPHGPEIGMAGRMSSAGTRRGLKKSRPPPDPSGCGRTTNGRLGIKCPRSTIGMILSGTDLSPKPSPASEP